MVVLCVAVTLVAWTLLERAPDKLLSAGMLRERWMDMLDPGPAKEYIREKMLVIRRIAEIMYRSFGLNG